MNRERRRFFAQVAGLVAGAVAAPHVKALPPAAPKHFVKLTNYLVLRGHTATTLTNQRWLRLDDVIIRQASRRLAEDVERRILDLPPDTLRPWKE